VSINNGERVYVLWHEIDKVQWYQSSNWDRKSFIREQT